MSLWSWELGAYARPGVPEACLRLQDEFGQNVSLLLWAYWAQASEGPALMRAVETARAWDAVALQPLRAVRRRLKGPCPPVADDAREALRQEVNAAELHSERVLADTLERLGGGPLGAASGLAALQAAVRAWGPPAPDEALAALAAALG
jgi:uncharacterized protein (TIGR02444 family)